MSATGQTDHRVVARAMGLACIALDAALEQLHRAHRATVPGEDTQRIERAARLVAGARQAIDNGGAAP